MRIVNATSFDSTLSTLSPLLHRIAERFRTGHIAGDPQEHLASLIHTEAPLLPEEESETLFRLLSSELFGFGKIQNLLDDPDVDDVLINGPSEVWVDRQGQMQRVDLDVSFDELHRYVERLVTPLGLQADRSHPIVDARLEDGTRVSVVLPPIAIDGPVLAFRRHRSGTIPLTHFCPSDVAGDLIGRLRVGQNIVIYGATGSGKTTVAQGLLATLQRDQRVVLVEDTAEIQLPDQHVVRLEARPGTTEGSGRVDLRELVRTALRLRPDHLVLGEVRGPEALDLLWALTTGHRGSVSTCHSHSGPGAVKRLAFLAARDPHAGPMSVVMELAHEAVDLVVGVQRSAYGQRVINRIEQVRIIGPGDFAFEVVYERQSHHRAVGEVDYDEDQVDWVDHHDR